MNFQTKIMTILIPIISSVIIGMGLWNFFEARKDVYQYTQAQLRIVLNETIQNELERRDLILRSAKMDSVDFFVDAYKQEAIDSIRQRMPVNDGHFIIIDKASKRTLLSPASYSREKLTPVLVKLKSKMETGAPSFDGRYDMQERNQHFYSAKEFAPWEWFVVYAIEGSKVHHSINTIFWRTTIGITVFVSMGIICIFWLTKKFLIKRILLLKNAAVDIANHQRVHNIPIESGDELGELARSMEITAAILDAHHKKQEEMKKELLDLNTKLVALSQNVEAQVQSRTTSLEAINRELRQNNASIKEELALSKEKRNELTVKLSELLSKQSTILQNHSAVLHKFQRSNDDNKLLRSQLSAAIPQAGVD